jgi:mannan endo-1,4-beta-mannosidase
MSYWDGTRWIDEPGTSAPRKHEFSPRSRMARFGDAIATVAMVAVLAAAFMPFTSAQATGASLTASPDEGAPGSSVEITGVALPPKSRLQVTWDGVASGMPSVRVNANGSMRTSIVVPNAEAGSHTVAVVEMPSKGGRTTTTKGIAPIAGVPFTLTAGSATPPPTGATPPPSAPVATPGSQPTPTIPATPAPQPTPAPTPSSTATSAPTPTQTPPPTTAPTAGPPQQSGFVRANGTQMTLNGSPYRFAGVNIYNANSRDNCWYPLGYNDDALATALSYIPDVDAFRAWFYQGQALKNGVRDWAAFDHTLAVAAQHGKKVVVQLSGQGGDCGDYPVDQQKTLSWYTTGYLATPTKAGYRSYRDWVGEFVARYANNPTILAYLLVGEAEAPNDQNGNCTETAAAAALRAFVDDVGGMVKALDSNHLLSLGVIGTGQCGSSGTNFTAIHGSPSIDVCTTEDYGKPFQAMPGDLWNGMQTRLNQCGSLNKPIFVQESAIKLDAEAGGSTATRASLFSAKLAAQFAGGMAGVLLWDYVAPHDPIYGGGDPRGYDLLVGDPALTLLGQY